MSARPLCARSLFRATPLPLPTSTPTTAKCARAAFPLLLSTPPPPPPTPLPLQPHRPSSSSSSTRWRTRQTSDPYTKSSKLSALKSRAAYKLLEIDARHRLFAPGQSVVDLGYAPGSWSQVARNRVGDGGRVVGIDVIPAMPPRGVSALQGDFLSEGVQGRVREFVREWRGGKGRGGEGSVLESGRGVEEVGEEAEEGDGEKRVSAAREADLLHGRVVDVVLSDMMMNTSGNPFRDHVGSIDLCMAALTFCHDCLRTGGHFLCKFYQGPEDKDLENRLKRLFEKVHRIKPDSSRKESRESYFVGLRRKADVSKEEALR
ncbi:hypothetical protein WHR41_08353 [Cladosporium halotolerans]|uniref:rRNA methyltransferase 2, mitochondrial n=1 Tax=Cladosporium halotolerans TaxID=1052096 RepID=A0AB34KHH0_9PEZI